MIRLSTTNTAPTFRRRHFARVETAWAMPRKYVSQSGTVNSLMAPILAVGASWRRSGVQTGSRVVARGLTVDLDLTQSAA